MYKAGVDFSSYIDKQALAQGLAALIATQLCAAIALRGHAVLSVPGGTTPILFLQTLARQSVPWEKVAVLLNDERFVPIDSPRSNTRLLHENFLNIAPAQHIKMYHPAPTPEAALPHLCAALTPHLPIDICVLGMGLDGHIASLFPHVTNLQAALSPAGTDPILAMHPADQDEPRLTLTAPVLLGAGHLHLLITGVDKRKVLEQAAQEGAVQDAPVRLLLNAPQGLNVHYAE